MKISEFDNAGVTLVYDGECPVCRFAVKTVKLKEKYGSLNLIDARQHPNHPLMAEI